MSALDAARDHYLERFRRVEEGLAGADPPWLRELRSSSLRAFAETGLPSPRLEEWRYTNLAPLAAVPFELAPAAPDEISREAYEEHAFPIFACSNFSFADGRYDAELSAPRALSAGTRVESLAALRTEAPERLEPYLGRQVDPKAHPLAALNTAFLDDGAALFVPPGARLEQPVHVVFLETAGAEPRVQHPRVLVGVGEGGHATLIQDFVSLGERLGFTNAVIEVRVERGGALDLILLQREGPETFHFSNLAARVERDARLSVHTLTLGGRLVRNDVSVLLADEHAECSLSGLFVGRRRQLIDNHTLVDHAMPHGTSRELYKGILGGHSKGVFRGRVIVRPDAQRSDARQSNPNLLLTDHAEIDTKPQLEIHADDVLCKHGSAIGNLDPDALFYLRSRGIGEVAARELLTRGFAAEILDALPVPALREGLAELEQSLVEGSAEEEDGR